MCPLLTDSLSCHRADACGATLSQSKPRFPLIRHLRTSISRSSIPDINDIHDHPTIIIGPEIRALAHFLSTTNDLANILIDMSYLTAFLEAPHRGSTMAQDSTYFDDQRASIECRILAMPFEEDKKQGSEAENIQEPCRLAALIYTNMVFRELQPSAAIHTILTSRLRTALMQTDWMSCWGNLSETLRWVLFMGGAVALRGRIRSWFVSVLTVVCSKLRIQSWHDIKEILVKYLWSDRIWEERCKNLWIEVEVEHRNCTSQTGLESV
jgi:hypothetical protein